MTNAIAPNTPAASLHMSKGWLVFGGLLSIFVGFAAMGSPYLSSFVIAQFLGIFALLSGVIALGLAIFGKHKDHRILEALSGIIRIAAGFILLSNLAASVVIITLVLAVALVVEGLFLCVASFRLKAHAGWVWTLVSGIASVVLGVMIYVRWPEYSLPILGLLFGINMLFSGISLLALGLSVRPPEAATV